MDLADAPWGTPVHTTPTSIVSSFSPKTRKSILKSTTEHARRAEKLPGVENVVAALRFYELALLYTQSLVDPGQGTSRRDSAASSSTKLQTKIDECKRAIDLGLDLKQAAKMARKAHNKTKTQGLSTLADQDQSGAGTHSTVPCPALSASSAPPSFGPGVVSTSLSGSSNSSADVPLAIPPPDLQRQGKNKTARSDIQVQGEASFSTTTPSNSRSPLPKGERKRKRNEDHQSEIGIRPCRSTACIDSTTSANCKEPIVISSDAEPDDEGASASIHDPRLRHQIQSDRVARRRQNRNPFPIPDLGSFVYRNAGRTSSTPRFPVAKELAEASQANELVLPNPVMPKAKSSSATSKSRSTSASLIQTTRQIKSSAKERGIVPLDLSDLELKSLSLVRSCSFCAKEFPKASSSKVRREHLSLCAPLNDILCIKIAVKAITDDMEGAIRRLPGPDTMLDHVVQSADIVNYESRPGQTQREGKKKRKQHLATKTILKRARSESSAHAIVSADKARAAARSMADLLLGARVAPDGPSNNEPSSISDHLNNGQHILTPSSVSANSYGPPLGFRFSSPSRNDEKGRKSTSRTGVKTGIPILELDPPASGENSSLPSMQPARRRGGACQSLETNGSNSTSGRREASPLAVCTTPPPLTQKFKPSKLAQRILAGKTRPSLFGATTTDRSLLDLLPAQPASRAGSGTCATPDRSQARRERKAESPITRNNSASASCSAEPDTASATKDELPYPAKKTSLSVRKSVHETPALTQYAPEEAANVCEAGAEGHLPTSQELDSSDLDLLETTEDRIKAGKGAYVSLSSDTLDRHTESVCWRSSASIASADIVLAPDSQPSYLTPEYSHA